MEGPVELLLALSPPVNGLNVVSPTIKAPPTTKGMLGMVQAWVGQKCLKRYILRRFSNRS
jgi:hypothetical protein